MFMSTKTPKEETRAQWVTELGHALQELRIAKGWSTRQLAVAARVPQSTVLRYESGEREPRAFNLVRLAQALRAEKKIFEFLRKPVLMN